LGGRAARLGRAAVIAVPYLWLAAFFLVPFLMVVRMSLSDVAQAIPPYRPVFEGLARLGDFLTRLDLENYALLWSDGLYLAAFAYSLRVAATATALTLLIAFPLAYAMARAPKRLQPVLLVLVILPFWTSFLIRVYALIGVLRPEGYLDIVLMGLGVTSGPLRLLATETAVLIGIVYSYLPFMVLPIYAVLEKLDDSLLEAAADLGAPPLIVFRTITLPLALPGILAGCFLVFIPAVGEFVIPDLLGGPDTLMIGRVLWTEFFSNRDWPLASAVAVVLLLVLVIPIVLLQRLRERADGGGR